MKSAHGIVWCGGVEEEGECVERQRAGVALLLRLTLTHRGV
jgi:hypothetical protein